MTAHAPRNRLAPWIGLAVTLVLAAAVRLAYWLQVRGLPLYAEPSGDAATYLLLAQSLRRDGPLAPLGEVYSQAPLYPFFLWLNGLLGLGVGAIRAVQFGLGVAGAGLLWNLGRRRGGPVAGLVAGILAATYGPLVFFEGELLSISLAVFLLILGLTLWGGRRAAWGAGLALGFAALAQPNLLLAGILVLAWSIWKPARAGWADRRAAILALAFLFLPPVVATARNLLVAGQPVLISSNGGINFFIGNNPAGDGTFHLPPDSGLLNRPEGLFTSAREAAEADAGRPLGAGAVDRYWGLKGVDFWLVDPGSAVALFARKALLSLNNFEIPNHYDYGYFRGKVPILLVLPTLAWVLPFGLVGLVLLVRRGRGAEAMWTAAILVSVALFFVTARYRLPVVALFIPAAGVAVARLWELRQRGSALVPYAAGIVAGAALALIPLISGGASQAHMMNLEGAAAYGRGDVPAAEAAFRRAVEVNPRNAEALNNLGRMLALQGKAAEAVEYYGRALAADPAQAETYFNLEDLYRRAGRLDEAKEILDRLVAARAGRVEDVAAPIAYRRGLVALAAADSAAAETRFGEAVAADPKLGSAWASLSGLQLARGDVGAAEASAKRAVEFAPRFAESWVALGAVQDATGRLQEAVESFKKAQPLDPMNAIIVYRIGHAYRLLGDIPQAETHYRASAQRAPYPPALIDLGRIYEELHRPNDAITVYRYLLAQEGPPSPERKEARARLEALGAGGHDSR